MNLWFVREDESFIVKFLAKQSNNKLRAGMSAPDFTVTIINPADSATTTPTVSELSSKPGLYQFTIPTSFLATHGVGYYSVVVEVDTKAGSGVGPHVIDAFAAILMVSTDDFNTIGANTALIPASL